MCISLLLVPVLDPAGSFAYITLNVAGTAASTSFARLFNCLSCHVAALLIGYIAVVAYIIVDSVLVVLCNGDFVNKLRLIPNPGAVCDCQKHDQNYAEYPQSPV